MYPFNNRIGKLRSAPKYCSQSFKVGLSPSKKNCVICLTESPLKMIKKHLLFNLKSSFYFQDI